MSKDIEIGEQTYEATVKGNNVGNIRSSRKCGPCMNNRHDGCDFEDCECRRNNHKVL